MREITPFDKKLKAAFRRSVEQAGGGVAVTRATGISGSLISQYGHPNNPTMPPINVVLLVDKLAADPFCARVLAEEWSCELVPFEGAGESDADILSTVAEIDQGNGELSHFTLRAISDHHLSPNDKEGIRNRIERQKEALRDLEEFTSPKATLRSIS